MKLRLRLYVLCWQYTAADTSWESTAATCGPKSSQARGRCRWDAGGPSRHGTASYRASSSSPCPAQTRSPGQCCQMLPMGLKCPYFLCLRCMALFLFKIKTLSSYSASFHLLICQSGSKVNKTKAPFRPAAIQNVLQTDFYLKEPGLSWWVWTWNVISFFFFYPTLT